VPRANAFFNTSLKAHFENVIKPYSKLQWVRHWVPQIIFEGSATVKRLGNTALTRFSFQLLLASPVACLYALKSRLSYPGGERFLLHYLRRAPNPCAKDL